MLDAIRRLRSAEMGFLETADAAALLDTTGIHASKIMTRLAEAEQLIRLKRGLWAFADLIDTLQIPGALTAPLPCYISLQSALYRHGLISQIPFVVYAVSPARTRRWNTPAGTVSIHHLDPAFFFGFEPVGVKGVQMAGPEKALLDVLYLSPAKSRLFQHLPELDIPASFDSRKAFAMIRHIPSLRQRTIVRQRLEALLGRDPASG
jgi:predicted transcriptional regulator of viral defense system